MCLFFFFGFSTWCKSVASDIGFKWRLELQRSHYLVYEYSSLAKTRNAPSAGTERDWSYGQMANPACGMPFFSSKTTSCNHSSWYSLSSRLCSAMHYVPDSPRARPWPVPWQGALARDHVHNIYGTVSYRLCIVIRKILRWNILLHSVLYNTHWRSSSLMKNLER